MRSGGTVHCQHLAHLCDHLQAQPADDTWDPTASAHTDSLSYLLELANNVGFRAPGAVIVPEKVEIPPRKSCSAEYHLANLCFSVASAGLVIAVPSHATLDLQSRLVLSGMCLNLATIMHSVVLLPGPNITWCECGPLAWRSWSCHPAGMPPGMYCQCINHHLLMP